jgi:WD40 repeat protein
MLALSADGRRLACCGPAVPEAGAAPAARWQLTVLDTVADQVVYTLPAAPDEVLTHPAFSPDGRWLAAVKTVLPQGRGPSTWPAPAHVSLWESPTGREAATLEVATSEASHFEIPGALAFSPDGTALASVGLQDGEGQVLVHDTATGRLRYPALKTNSFLIGVTFSPDGRRLAVNAYDGLIRLWDAATGKQVLTLRGFETPGDGNYAFAGRVVFSTDGRRLAANGWYGIVSVWDCGRPLVPAAEGSRH